MQIIVNAFQLAPGLAQKHEAKIAAVMHRHEGRKGRLPPSAMSRPGPVPKEADSPIVRWRQGLMELMADGCGWRVYDLCAALGAPRDEIEEALRILRRSCPLAVDVGPRWTYWSRVDDMARENKRLDGAILGEMRRGTKYLTSQLAPSTGRNVNACANRLGVMYRKGIVDRDLVGKTSHWFLA